MNEFGTVETIFLRLKKEKNFKNHLHQSVTFSFYEAILQAYVDELVFVFKGKYEEARSYHLQTILYTGNEEKKTCFPKNHQKTETKK